MENIKKRLGVDANVLYFNKDSKGTIGSTSHVTVSAFSMNRQERLLMETMRMLYIH